MGVILATRWRGVPEQQSHLNVITITLLTPPKYQLLSQGIGTDVRQPSSQALVSMFWERVNEGNE